MAKYQQLGEEEIGILRLIEAYDSEGAEGASGRGRKLVLSSNLTQNASGSAELLQPDHLRRAERFAL